MSQTARKYIGTTEAAALIGASEASVKRWSDSGVLVCERTPGGHRRFVLSEVESFAARLRATPGDGFDALDAEGLSRLALAGDVASLEEALRPRWTGALQIADLADMSIGPALARVGTLWELGHISIAEEHLATASFRQAVAGLSSGLPRPHAGVAVICCLGDEEHDFAASLIALALRVAGFESQMTGARTPAEDAARLVLRASPRLVAVSITGAVRRSGSSRDLALIGAAARQVPAQLWMGGRHAAEVQVPRGARVAGTLREMIAAVVGREI